MNFLFFIVGVLSVALGIFIMLKNKFYKYETSDMLFVTKLKVFLGAAILVLYGLLILINEVKKVIS
ncbi:hypothetical protein OC25_26040 [Pedobacter kyungheensis]|uniref:Uncharacterized protein n=1 Tax=Pedobacter kyungheensis TaxID=1069985 RepID=A0A0C1CW75_9SPHI|nr:hypothetical protein [Pedobacter kyungheensis]KIA88626.1 hypothetical protein OC25_26040 [Pedobacter kyungheensis]